MFCNLCFKEFKTDKGLNIHVAKFHKCDEEKTSVCDHCSNSYQSSKSLSNHIRNVHTPTEHPLDTYKCNLCDDNFSKRNELLEHLRDGHEIGLLIQTHNFHTIDELNKFLLLTLRQESGTFYKSTGKKITNDKCTSYYNCVQSNVNSRCVSYIKILEYNNNKSKAEFCLFHNHTVEIDRIKLPYAIKNKLILKIKQKIGLKDIYKELLDDIGPKVTKKSDMVTINYLRYLKHRYASPCRYDIDDISNLKKLIKEKEYPQQFSEYLRTPESTAHNIVPDKPNHQDIKPKIFTLLEYSEQEDISSKKSTEKQEPFIFAFSSPRFSPNNYNSSYTVMADSTYGTNVYNYHLIVYGFVSVSLTFLPFLYIITDSETEATCTYVLKKYLSFTGVEVTANFFMSDMSSIFFQSWCNTFNVNPQWLYCIWHVKKAVKKHLNNKVKDKDKRFNIDQKFEELTKIPKEEEFNRKLQLFERYTERKNKDFSTYFKKYYSAHKDRWCLPSRINSIVNTNMFIEAFFGVFKRTYLSNKSRNRLDVLFNALLLFETHTNANILRQSVSNQKKFMGYRAQVASHKHKLGNKLDKTKFKYDLDSNSFFYKKYEIRKGTCDNCGINCKFVCHSCKICYSRYICSCLSFSMKKECCKHVHVAHDLFKEKENTYTQDDISKDDSYGSLVDYNESSHDNQVQNSNLLQYDINEDINENIHIISSDDKILSVSNQETSKNNNKNSEVITKNKGDLIIEANINREIYGIKLEINRSLEKIKPSISNIYDKNILKRVNEELTMLNDFISYSKADDKTVDLEIEPKMMKKQKTQRSWFK